MTPARRWPRAPAPGDLVVAVVALAAAAVLATTRPSAGPARAVVVEVDGSPVRRVGTDTTTTFHVRGRLGSTTIRVEPGRARIEAAPCAQHLCVRRGWIDAAGQAAVCVPNAVVVRLVGGPRAFDGVSQ